MSAQERTANAPPTVISLQHVHKTYAQWQRSGETQNVLLNLLRPEKRIIQALDDVSFTVERGELVAYAGANGAGKSTTLKMMAGMLQQESGNISVLGMDPLRQRQALMHRLGVLFGNRTELWWDHPIQTSFEWKKVVWNIPDDLYKRNLAEVTELLDIADLLKTFARELSLGQRMRADLAMLLLHSPELIILDEPTLGLDVLSKRRMIDFLQQLNRERGVTIIITSHDIDDLEAMAKRIILLSNGTLAFDGSFEQLRQVGNFRRRLILTTAHTTAPELASAQLVESRETIHEYEYNPAQVPLQQLLTELGQHDEILDIETGKAPIEEVVAALYQQWRDTQPE